MLHREIEIPAGARDRGQCVIRWGLPRLIPGGFVKSVVSIGRPAPISKREAEVIERLPIIGVRVALRQPGYGLPEMLLGRTELSPSQEQKTHGVVATGISGVAPQRLQPVALR